MAGTAKKAFGGAKVIYVARFEKESKQAEPETGDIVERPMSEQKGDLIAYYSRMTDFNSYHARCLRVKSDCTVNLGLEILNVPKEDAARDRLAVVNEMGQSFQEVIARVSLDFETTGNGYLEIVRNRAGQVEELYYAPAVLMKRRKRGEKFPFVYQGSAESVDFYAYKTGEKPGDPEHGEILHFCNYTDKSRYYGLPDWRGAVPDIEVDYYAVLYNQKFFVNSGVPDLAIVVEGGQFDEETEKKVVEFFQSNFKGLENAHRTLYLPINDQEVSVRFEKLALDVKDRDGSFDKLRARCRDNIVSAHGVPPRLVGIVVSGQLGGGGEIHGQLKVFQEVTINPRQTLFETKLQPILKDMGIDADFKFQELDTKIQEKDSEYYPALVGAGILDANEAREDLGYGPREEEQETGSPPEEKLVDALEKIYKEL